MRDTRYLYVSACTSRRGLSDGTVVRFIKMKRKREQAPVILGPRCDLKRATLLNISTASLAQRPVVYEEALNARAFGSTRYVKTGISSRSRDKKKGDPRAKRKPAVIRVSLGARSPHYSCFIQTRAARLYYFLVTSLGRTRVRYSSFPFVPRYYCYDHCFPLHPRGLAFSLLFSPYVCLPSSASFTVASVCGTLLKNYTSKPLWPFSPALPSTAYGTSPLSFRRERDFSEATFRQRLRDASSAPVVAQPSSNFQYVYDGFSTYDVFVTEGFLSLSLSLSLCA